MGVGQTRFWRKKHKNTINCCMIKSVSGTIGNERRKIKNKWKKKGEEDEEEKDEEKKEEEEEEEEEKEKKEEKEEEMGKKS
jgi:hypothetical protein